jgi:outer membrane protein, heavy metal efflux system
MFIAVVLQGCTSAARDERARFAGTQAPSESFLGALTAEFGPPDAGDLRDVMAHESVSLEELLIDAEINSPQLAAAYFRWQSAIESIGTAVRMPDAMLEYTEYLRVGGANIEPMGERRGVMLSQMITNPGMLSARQRTAAAEAAVMGDEFESVKRELRRRATVAFVDIQLLDRRRDITAELVSILEGIEQVMEARLETGQATQAELLRVQIRREELAGDLESFDLRRPALVRTLEAITGVPLRDHVDLPPLPEAGALRLPANAELVASLDNHPSLAISHARARAAGAKIDEAGWMFVPDFILGVEWMHMERRRDMPFTSAVGVTGGVTIPWQVHVSTSRRNAALAAKRAARLVIAQKRLDLAADLERNRYELLDAERMTRLVAESTLPRARQALELVRADLGTGRATLTDVFSTLNTVLAGELSLADARASSLRARAGLEALTGLELEQHR